ncbi:MAG TPA: zinc-binding dehydrogenase [Candidatus Tectomicrobia bacterium]|jgi:L-iditol 2-dehydrogenase|nr:zinc-binding dehydrogenase [Candidatus Tectomicrobia bacterium]
MKMRAALFYGPKDVRLETVDAPRAGAGEVIVKVEVALTCGTDLKTFQRGHPVLLKRFPSPFGHEFAGVVAEVGVGVEGFHPGMRVVAANSAPCHQCFYCRAGETNLCENLDLLNGAYAEQIRIPAAIVRENLLTIPDSLSFRAAAFCEPLACVLHGLDAVQLRPGEHVAILGAGSIGLLLVQICKRAGARVILVSRSAGKLKLARELGADAVIDLETVRSREGVIRELTSHGQGVEVAIEAVGRPELWELAVALTRKGGSAILFGGCESGTTMTLETKTLHYGERKVIGVFHHTPKAIRRALELIASQQLQLDPLITDDLPLSELGNAFTRMASHGALKMAIYP